MFPFVLLKFFLSSYRVYNNFSLKKITGPQDCFEILPVRKLKKVEKHCFSLFFLIAGLLKHMFTKRLTILFLKYNRIAKLIDFRTFTCSIRSDQSLKIKFVGKVGIFEQLREFSSY